MTNTWKQQIHADSSDASFWADKGLEFYLVIDFCLCKYYRDQRSNSNVLMMFCGSTGLTESSLFWGGRETTVTPSQQNWSQSTSVLFEEGSDPHFFSYG